ncbi:hypothetical protein SAMN04487830_14216 [Pseudobutyrivibrio sp. OR37]|uniref:hypothetical protein n=1 Tax=Pseudobutyrivibrio sp. OR37 TaxID=1798186 RepID=UPI0008E78475|nr:hypothetical protein [Pseudobutyrivibrio sp. OR37]SFI32361.1 hypothetical protein SAMN04487830_14216 [Pseudobutyrivibrio sp. OR37]
MNIKEVAAKLYSDGKIDERKLFSVANAKRLPQGYGYIGLGLKGDNLVIFDYQFKTGVGEVIYDIPIADVEKLKVGAFLGIFTYLKFTYCGGKFNIQNFAFSLGIEAAIREAHKAKEEKKTA